MFIRLRNSFDALVAVSKRMFLKMLSPPGTLQEDTVETHADQLGFKETARSFMSPDKDLLLDAGLQNHPGNALNPEVHAEGDPQHPNQAISTAPRATFPGTAVRTTPTHASQPPCYAEATKLLWLLIILLLRMSSARSKESSLSPGIPSSFLGFLAFRSKRPYLLCLQVTPMQGPAPLS